MAGTITSIVLVKDEAAGEALQQLNTMLCALENQVARTLVLATLTSPLDCAQFRLTTVGTPTTPSDLLTFGTLTGLLGAAITRFLRQFPIITPDSP